ncbi:MAG: Fic family protein [Micrococcales bacterium]|nr:Fic family protein [Micrococcales bacterium]
MTYRPFPSFAQWRPELDLSLVDRYAARMHAAKQGASSQSLDAALTVVLRSAAVDTGAIEGLYTTDRGFTRTVATQAAAWELAADEKGAHVRQAIADAIAGYEQVMDAVTGSHLPDITQAWIRHLHSTMLASQETYRVFVPALGGFQDQPLPKGAYKSMPNNPTRRDTGQVHDYAPPSDTPAEMARLVDELAAPAFCDAHPVLQACYAHYAFVCVHPFADGNGRVARALASVYLYRNPGVPFLVFADQRDTYLDGLEAADTGDSRPFVEFAVQRVIDTVNLVEQSIAAAGPEPDTNGLAEWAEKLPDADEPIAAGQRLAQLCLPRLRAAVTALLPPGVDVDVVLSSTGEGPDHVPDGYECWNSFRASVPGGLVRCYHVAAADREGQASADAARIPSLLLLDDEGATHAEVWLRELEPVVSKALELRLDAWARAAAHGFVQRLAADVRDAEPSGT